jgi:hypothetical protein
MMICIRARAILSLACFGLLTAFNSHALAALRTVALSGQQPPGTSSGVSFVGFVRGAVINGAGKTAFYGTVAGSGVSTSNDSGVWSEGSGSLALLVRKGSQAAGTPSGVNYNVLLDLPLLNTSGKAAVSATLTGSGVTGANDLGLWSGVSDNVSLVAREGNSAPGTPNGVTFSLVTANAVMNGAGNTAFRGRVTGSGVGSANDDGIWSETSGVVSLVAREGDHPPGTPAGVIYSGQASGPVLNAAGQIAFSNGLSGTGITGSNNEAIWLGTPGNLNLVVRLGDQAPGTPSGVVFDFSFPRPAINASGAIAFHGDLSGSGIDGSNDSGIWSGSAGNLKLVARAGSHAPGTPSGTNFDNFVGAQLVLNDAGKTSFVSYLEGTGVDVTNDTGLWSEGSGNLALVAREGSQAAELPSGVNYGAALIAVLNAAGQTAFYTDLSGSGVNSSNNAAIFATDTTGAVHLIAREGNALEVAAADFRTISTLNFLTISGNGDGRTSAFNDLGQLAFSATFTDGSAGVFVSDLVANSVLPGDFNHNGRVDAADYVVWRKTDPTNQSAYNTWRSHFGQPSGGGSASSMADTQTAPEATSLLLLGVGSLSLPVVSQRRSAKRGNSVWGLAKNYARGPVVRLHVCCTS